MINYKFGLKAEEEAREMGRQGPLYMECCLGHKCAGAFTTASESFMCCNTRQKHTLPMVKGVYVWPTLCSDESCDKPFPHYHCSCPWCMTKRMKKAGKVVDFANRGGGGAAPPTAAAAAATLFFGKP